MTANGHKKQGIGSPATTCEATASKGSISGIFGFRYIFGQLLSLPQFFLFISLK